MVEIPTESPLRGVLYKNSTFLTNTSLYLGNDKKNWAIMVRAIVYSLYYAWVLKQLDSIYSTLIVPKFRWYAKVVWRL